MRLCFVASGISIHTKKWVDWFASHGHEVYLITPPYDQPLVEFHPEVAVHVLPKLWPVRWRGSRIVNMPLWIGMAATLIHDDIRPDLVEGQYIGMPGYTARWAMTLDPAKITQPPYMGLLGLTRRGQRRYPLVLQCWGSDILIEAQKPWYRWMTKNCLKRADMVFCDSETVKIGLLGLDTDMRKVRKVYNGIDTQFFSPDSRPRRNIVISTRSFEPVYRQEVLMSAIPRVLEHFPKTKFVLIGDGSEKQMMENATVLLGVQDSVTFTGALSQREVRDWLRVSRIYVSTSRSDSTSLSLQEAMACELPCVVSDLSANREWIEHEISGMIAEVGNSFDVADRIKQLLRDDERRARFGKLGRMKVVQEADYDRNMGKVEQHYRALIGGEQ